MKLKLIYEQVKKVHGIYKINDWKNNQELYLGNNPELKNIIEPVLKHDKFDCDAHLYKGKEIFDIEKLYGKSGRLIMHIQKKSKNMYNITWEKERYTPNGGTILDSGNKDLNLSQLENQLKLLYKEPLNYTILEAKPKVVANKKFVTTSNHNERIIQSGDGIDDFHIDSDWDKEEVHNIAKNVITEFNKMMMPKDKPEDFEFFERWYGRDDDDDGPCKYIVCRKKKDHDYGFFVKFED